MPMLLGDYVCQKLLGQGGMGEVYLATDTQGQCVAVKRLRSDITADPLLIRRFERESKLALLLDHPRIVSTIEVGRTPEGEWFLVSEFCSGGSVGQELEERGLPPIGRAVSWMLQSAEALDYAWTCHQLIHRDIKPDNLLRDVDGNIKISDFGLAKALHADMTQLTAEGDVMGTPEFIAPEQAEAKPSIDVRADIYSLGATFFRVLTGQPLFTGPTIAHILLAHVEAPPQSPRALRPDMPLELDAVILKMLAKNPADRYQEPAHLLKILSALKSAQQPPLNTHAHLAGLPTIQDEDSLLKCGPRPQEITLDDNSAAELDAPATTPFAALPTLEDDTDLLQMPRASKVVAGRRQPVASPRHELRRQGLAVTWAQPAMHLTITIAGARQDMAVFAGPRVVFGRTRQGNLRLPLRVYPIAQNESANYRISSEHGEFQWNGRQWSVIDRGSSNGTRLNGQRLDPHVAQPLNNDGELNVADVVRLQLQHQFLDDGAWILDGRHLSHAAQPALTIRRVGNRPELSYAAMMLALPVLFPGTADNRIGIIWWVDNSFWWRVGDTLEAIAPGACVTAMNCELRFAELTPDLFR